jgi:hypothetical protein
MQYVQGLCQSRVSTADYDLISSSSCYNSGLVTWTAVCLTVAKFKPFIFSMSGFALSDIVNTTLLTGIYELEAIPSLLLNLSNHCNNVSIVTYNNRNGNCCSISEIFGRLSRIQKGK